MNLFLSGCSNFLYDSSGTFRMAIATKETAKTAMIIMMEELNDPCLVVTFA